MRNLARHAVAALLLLAAIPTKGSETVYRVPTYVHSYNYTVKEGLSSNHIYGIVQDSIGFIWLGTGNGLCRFDGRSFRPYLHTGSDRSSISSNNIRRLMIDRHEQIWISLDNGVDIYDTATGVFRHFDARTADSLAVEGQTIEIIEDTDGEIWISTVNSGVFRYSPETEQLRVYRHDPDNENSLSQDYVSTLYESSDGTIWIGTYSEGLCAFSKNTEQFTRYRKARDSAAGPSSDSIDAITEDSYGNIWLGTVDAGLDRFDRTTGRFTNYGGARFGEQLTRIHYLKETAPGELIVCSENGAARFRISELGLQPIEESDPDFFRIQYINVYSFLKDREGNFWFGSLNNGVEFFPSHNDFTCYILRREEHINSGHAANTICPFGNNTYLLGTPDSRILLFDEHRKTLSPYRETRYAGTSGHDVNALLIDDGTLWSAAFQCGIEAYDMKTGRTRSYLDNPADPSSRVFKLFRSSNGRIWAGTSVGLYHYDRAADNFIPRGPVSLITAIAEDLDGRIWAGTSDSGICTFDTRNSQVRQYTYDRDDTTTISRNTISALAVDRANRVWIGTKGYGLCHYDRNTDRFVRHENLNLPGSDIIHIVPDGECLWISTDRGLAAYFPDTGQLKYYTHDDGLCSDLFVSNMGFRTPEGRILFGTNSGICLFNPHELIENHPANPVIITDFTLDNQSVRPDRTHPDAVLKVPVERTKQITLKHRQNALGFAFVSPGYHTPGTILYRYRLDGLDEKWHRTDSRNTRVGYNNLAPGEYRFRVQAGEDEQNWNTPETVISLKILPPPLLSKPAYTIYAILLLAALGLCIRLLLQHSEKKHREKIAQIQRENERRLYDQRINFFTNIAHEIRTPLSLIIGPLEYVMKARHINDQYGEYLSIIERNYHRLYTLVNQLLDFRKIDSNNYKLRYDTCDVGKLVRNLLDLFRPTLAQRGMRFVEELPESGPMLVTDREALTKIVSNLLSNAVKFARTEIRIRIHGCGEGVGIEVTDDGPGIPPEEFEQVFDVFYQASNNDVSAGRGGVGIGLHMCRTYVQMMNGTISASARPDGRSGAQFTLFLPHPATEPASERIHNPAGEACPRGGVPAVSTGNTARMESSGIVDDPEEKSLTSEAPETGPSDPSGLSENGPERTHTVLAVDDNSEILDFLTRVLGNDYSVIAATNATQALDLLRNNDVDLVVSDIMMEGIDGIELCRQIKNDIGTSHIPVILLTAKTDISTKIESLEGGADAYIEKPFSPEHLKAQIANLLLKLNEFRRRYSGMPMSEFRTLSHNQLDEEFIEKCRTIIIEHMSEPNLSVELLARELAMSRTSLFKKLKAVTDMTPNDFMKLIRLKEASRLLAEGRYRISEIGFIAGFSSSSYFAKCFAKQFGVLPTEFLRNLEQNAAPDTERP